MSDTFEPHHHSQPRTINDCQRLSNRRPRLKKRLSTLRSMSLQTYKNLRSKRSRQSIGRFVFCEGLILIRGSLSQDEAKAYINHSKVLNVLKKQESAFLVSKSRYESLQGQVSAEAERLEAVRESAKTATERVAEKCQEVDGLRKMFGLDEREREVKLGELKETGTSLLWKF